MPRSRLPLETHGLRVVHASQASYWEWAVEVRLKNFHAVRALGGTSSGNPQGGRLALQVHERLRL